jgi:hypothetical protein
MNMVGQDDIEDKVRYQGKVVHGRDVGTGIAPKVNSLERAHTSFKYA